MFPNFEVFVVKTLCFTITRGLICLLTAWLNQLKSTHFYQFLGIFITLFAREQLFQRGTKHKLNTSTGRVVPT